MSGSTVVTSEYAGDPCMRELLTVFEEHLERRLAAMRWDLEMDNLEAVGDVAHQILGTAGGFGFPELTELARDLEASCREGDREAARAALECVLAYSERIRID